MSQRTRQPRTPERNPSFADIVEFVKGPRMALIVDPGDGAYGTEIGGGSR